MWVYVKQLEYPVRVSRPDLAMAKNIFAQFGGPDSEFSASWRYLTQAWIMPSGVAKAIVIDIGTEELAHLEMVGTMINLLIADATPEEMDRAGLGAHYVEHGRSLFLHDAAGVPWTSSYVQSHDDPVTNLHEDMAAEQKARTTYEHLICKTTDDQVRKTLAWLREREVVHFQRFGEALDRVQEKMAQRLHF